MTAVFLNNAALATRYAPGPSMERGHALNVYVGEKEARVVYAFSKYVVVRSLTDSSDNFVYRGHKYPVGCARFSPNGYWIASGDEAGNVRVWAWDNPEHILKVEVQVFAGAVKDIVWDNESKKICAVGDGKGVVAKVFVWDTGNNAGEMVGHTKKAITVAYRQARPFRIMTGSEDFKVCFYKGPPFKMDHSEKAHGNYVNCIRYAPNNDLAASVGSDKKLVLYDGKEGTIVREVTGSKTSHPQGSIYSVVFSPDSTKLLTAAADKSVKLWTLAEGAPDAVLASLTVGSDVADMQMAVLWAHETPISISLSGEFNYLSVSDSAIAISKIVSAPQAPISTMTVLPASGDVVVGCNDGTVFVVQASEGKEWKKVLGNVKGSITRACHGGKVTVVAPTDDGFVSAGFDDTVRFARNSADGAQYEAEHKVEGQPNGLAQVESTIVACTTTKGVALVCASRGVLQFVATSYDPTAVACCAAELVVGAKDGSLRILDAATLAEKRALPSHRGEITALAFTNDGATLAAADADREVKLYGVAEGYVTQLSEKWRYHTARVTALAWNASGSHLATTSNDEAIFVWSKDAPSAVPLKFDFAHKDGSTALAWKGAQLVSAGNDGCCCLWNVTV